MADAFFFDTADFTCTIIFNIEDMLFLIYLGEIVCSMATTDNSVAFFRIEAFSHWLDRSLST